ncbi:Salicylate hydroxylase [Leucoagaricus sp. SymC.cos]|nr:Salicylate hydroxylase [Leucoagaricus sp. SymC.cos]
MLPYQGAGAGSGIEDAYILATLLTHPSIPCPPGTRDIAKVLDIYNRVRVPSAAAMMQATVKQGALYTLDVPELEPYKEGDRIPMDALIKVFTAASENWSWTATDPEEERRIAVDLLQVDSSL